MGKQLINILATIIAGCMIMILHELPKAIVYNVKNKDQGIKQKSNIYKVFHYIDPIGLIFCITTYSGFSKPYMYRIKEKKTNLLLGITGFVSLFCVFLVSLLLLKVNYGKEGLLTFDNNFEFFYKYLAYAINYFTAVISLSMIFVNLFPISTFNMGLLIAAKSPSKYFSVIKNDYFIKLLLIVTIIFGLIETFSVGIIWLLV